MGVGQVPQSYIAFQEVISAEVGVYRTNGQPAILNQREFAALANKIPNNDILDLEELSVGEYLGVGRLVGLVG